MDELKETLTGGQSFSWSFKGGAWEAVLNEKVYRIKSLKEAEQDPFLCSYFDLDFDYARARAVLAAKDEHLKAAVEMFPHLRILRQDIWISLISFILSQNNNIKRIKGLYDRLSVKYGHSVAPGYYSFPTPRELLLATAEDLRALGAGFRDKYIIDAVRNSYRLEKISSLDFDSAMRELEQIKGIGPKVASCVLLFGDHRMSAFPVDVWMKKVLSLWYPGVSLDYFEPYPALSQQYLFSYARAIKLKI